MEKLWKWQSDIEHFHDGLHISFIWLRLPFAAWLQKPIDGRNTDHPPLERLDGSRYGLL